MEHKEQLDESYQLHNVARVPGEYHLWAAIINQAVSDVLSKKCYVGYKINAMQFLADEDNTVLQLCLQACNIDHERLLRKLAKKAWNLNL